MMSGSALYLLFAITLFLIPMLMGFSGRNRLG